MAFGPVALLLLMLMSGGPKDLVSMIDAEIYFQQEGVAYNEAEFLKILGQAANDPDTRLQKLLAIRELGQRKAVAAKDALQGLAKDPDYFTRQYATTALARIEGRAPPVAKANWAELLNSLPPQTQTVLGLDLARIPEVDLMAELPKLLGPMLPMMMGMGPGGPPDGPDADPDAMMQQMLEHLRRQSTMMALEAYKRVGNFEIKNITFLANQAEAGFGVALWIRGVYDRERWRAELLKEAHFRPAGNEWFLTNRPPGQDFGHFAGFQEIVLGQKQVIVVPQCNDRTAPSPAVPILQARKAGRPGPGCEEILALLGEDVTSQMFWAATLVPEPLKEGLAGAPAPPVAKMLVKELQHVILTISDAKPPVLTLRATLANAEPAEHFARLFTGQKTTALQMMKAQGEEAPAEAQALMQKAIAALEGLQIQLEGATITITTKLDATLAALPMWIAKGHQPRHVPPLGGHPEPMPGEVAPEVIQVD